MRLGGRSGSAPRKTRPSPASAKADRSTTWSRCIASMAATAPSAGGPDSSTAPPGSTVTLLPHGRSGRNSRTVPISSQLGLRYGSAGSWQCPSTSRPTDPSGASTRQPAAMYSAAAVESAISACAAPMAANVISRSLRARARVALLHLADRSRHISCPPLLTQRVLHCPGQDVDRGARVARLADFGLQQNVFAQPGLIEASAVGARFLLGPVRIGTGGRAAVERPHLRDPVVQVHRGGLPRATDGPVHDPMESPARGVVGREYPDRLLDVM